MKDNKRNIEIIVVDENYSANSLGMCLCSLTAFIDPSKIRINIFTTRNQEEIDKVKSALMLINNQSVIFTIANSLNYLNVMLEVVNRINNNDSDLIFISDRAVGSDGWLSSMQEVVSSNSEVAAVISREIHGSSDRKALELVPYAIAGNDVDISLSPFFDMKIVPDFDESLGLISLSKIKLFCTYFSKSFMQKINWDYYYPLGNNFFIDEVSYYVQSLNMSIVYTARSKVFDASCFI